MKMPRRDLPAAGVIFAITAVSVLNGSAVFAGVRAPVALSADPDQYEAPIGHRQPRPRALPESVQRAEQQMNAEHHRLEKALDKPLDKLLNPRPQDLPEGDQQVQEKMNADQHMLDKTLDKLLNGRNCRGC